MSKSSSGATQNTGKKSKSTKLEKIFTVVGSVSLLGIAVVIICAILMISCPTFFDAAMPANISGSPIEVFDKLEDHINEMYESEEDYNSKDFRTYEANIEIKVAPNTPCLENVTESQEELPSTYFSIQNNAQDLSIVVNEEPSGTIHIYPYSFFTEEDLAYNFIGNDKNNCFDVESIKAFCETGGVIKAHIRQSVAYSPEDPVSPYRNLNLYKSCFSTTPGNPFSYNNLLAHSDQIAAEYEAQKAAEAEANKQQSNSQDQGQENEGNSEENEGTSEETKDNEGNPENQPADVNEVQPDEA